MRQQLQRHVSAQDRAAQVHQDQDAILAVYGLYGLNDLHRVCAEFLAVRANAGDRLRWEIDGLASAEVAIV